MQVNKNSWHYKLLTEKFFFISGWHEWNVSRSLCLYFWQVMFRLVSGVGLGLIVVSPFFSWTMLLLDLDPSVAGISGALLVVMGIFVTGAVGFLLIIFVLTCIVDYIRDKLPRRDYKEKEPNLVVEYLKAKKNKVCPIIEFVEEE